MSKIEDLIEGQTSKKILLLTSDNAKLKEENDALKKNAKNLALYIDGLNDKIRGLETTNASQHDTLEQYLNDIAALTEEKTKLWKEITLSQ